MYKKLLWPSRSGHCVELHNATWANSLLPLGRSGNIAQIDEVAQKSSSTKVEKAILDILTTITKSHPLSPSLIPAIYCCSVTISGCGKESREKEHKRSTGCRAYITCRGKLLNEWCLCSKRQNWCW
jgi:hypothetical protein